MRIAKLSHCPLCGAQADARVLAKSSELRAPISDFITQQSAGWQAAQGLCPACADKYTKRFNKERSSHSLHTASQPPTTFPFYHPAEETVLSQPERLPDYPMFNGRGITIAFLDSGYFPHPDLTETPVWPRTAPAWGQLTPDEMRAVLQPAAFRFVEYVDLTDNSERVGVDQPSLWDGGGDSWHGQMTTAVAVGNGLLSNGHFRGYAPRARVLAIKIGRGGGRIPEEDILRGLHWLLQDDHWRRYRVSVLNISVGGDFPELWQNNAVCLAAEALSAKGVLIAAAAGNRGREELLAPAQAPSVLTVGGYDDANHVWRPEVQKDVKHLTLYPHNYGAVWGEAGPIHKPEILAPARWVPAPVLPVSSVFREMVTLSELRQVLASRPDQTDAPTWLHAVYQGVRTGMNAHKWVHPYYQHVDGTSVAVAQVSAVAAQVFEANPNLPATTVRKLLLDTALPLPDKPAAQTGSGVIQPARAVAAALRINNGILDGLPKSATFFALSELPKWLDHGKVPLSQPAYRASQRRLQPVYLGYYAPQATAVSLVGSFNNWDPESFPLQRLPQGWWHGIIILPPGHHHYRFWLDTGRYTPSEWQADPENPLWSESGYQQAHSVIVVE